MSTDFDIKSKAIALSKSQSNSGHDGNPANGHLSQCTTVTKKLNLIFLKIQTHVALLPLFEKKAAMDAILY